MNTTTPTAPPKPLAVWLPHVLRQFEAMRAVRENWDGYNGAAPTPAAIDAAVRDVRVLAELASLPEPYASPARDGGVGLDWEVKPHSLEVGWRPDGTSYYVYMHLDEKRTESGEVFDGFDFSLGFLLLAQLLWAVD